MEVEIGLIERLEARHLVDCIQTDESSAVQVGAHTGALAGLEQFPQATVPKTLDQQWSDVKRRFTYVKRRLTGKSGLSAGKALHSTPAQAVALRGHPASHVDR